mgnify:CR=1 FL=1
MIVSFLFFPTAVAEGCKRFGGCDIINDYKLAEIGTAKSINRALYKTFTYRYSIKNLQSLSVWHTQRVRFRLCYTRARTIKTRIQILDDKREVDNENYSDATIIECIVFSLEIQFLRNNALWAHSVHEQ